VPTYAAKTSGFRLIDVVSRSSIQRTSNCHDPLKPFSDACREELKLLRASVSYRGS